MSNELSRELVQETQASNSGQDNGWQAAANDCWQANKCQTEKQNQALQASSETKDAFSLAAADLKTSNPDWLEERATLRKRELASQFGLDPDKASMDDVIKVRSEQGTAQNAGRVERLRAEEAVKYGLDPTKSDWTQINIARVDARKRELGMEK